MIITTCICDICKEKVECTHRCITIGVRSAPKELVTDPRYSYCNTYGHDLCDSCLAKFEAKLDEWKKAKAVA